MVAYVLTQHDRATGMSYELEDGTGTISGILYSEEDGNMAPTAFANVQNQYVKVGWRTHATREIARARQDGWKAAQPFFFSFVHSASCRCMLACRLVTPLSKAPRSL